MTDEVKKLKELIDGTDNIVFFGGAGVSTESGIPDFRSVDGLYHQQWDDPPETILSHTYYERYPEKFFAFYRAKLLCEGAKPNAAHLKLAEWEKEGKLKAVITQNIDGLHQAAGSKNVLELHGSTLRNYCEKCGKFYDVSYIKHSQGVPRCTCGGRIKPTWCSTKRAWTKRHSIARWSTFRRPTCSSSRAHRSRSIRRRASCATIADTSSLSSTRRRSTADLVPTLSSREPWGRRSRSFNTKKMPEKFGKSELFRHFSYSKIFYFFSQKKVDIWPILGL